jgi:hypothetical protein
VLDDDPFELGADRLKDVRVAGTVFEGELFLLPKPLASSLATNRDGSGSMVSNQVNPMETESNRGRYTAMAASCCQLDGDPCVFIRQVSGWLQNGIVLH